MFNAYGRAYGIGARSSFVLRGFKSVTIAGLLYGSFGCYNFASAQLTRGAEVIFDTTTRGLCGALGLTLASCRQIGFSIFNVLNRVASVLYGYQYFVIFVALSIFFELYVCVGAYHLWGLAYRVYSVRVRVVGGAGNGVVALTRGSRGRVLATSGLLTKVCFA